MVRQSKQIVIAGLVRCLIEKWLEIRIGFNRPCDFSLLRNRLAPTDPIKYDMAVSWNWCLVAGLDDKSSSFPRADLIEEMDGVRLI